LEETYSSQACDTLFIGVASSLFMSMIGNCEWSIDLEQQWPVFWEDEVGA